MNAVISIFEHYGWAGINAVVICTILIYAGKYAIKKLTSNMKTGLEDVGEKLTNKMSEQNEHLVHTIIGQQDKILTHILDNLSIHASLLTHLPGRSLRVLFSLLYSSLRQYPSFVFVLVIFIQQQYLSSENYHTSTACCFYHRKTSCFFWCVTQIHCSIQFLCLLWHKI